MATLATLSSRLANELLRDPNNRIRPAGTLTYAINTAQNKLQSDFGSMIDDVTSTASTAIGTQEYDLPTDFNRLSIVTFGWIPLLKTSLKSLRECYTTFTQWTPSMYYLRPWVIGLYPIPSTVASLYIIYNNILPTITTSQNSSLPVILDDAMLYRAATICYRQVGRQDMAQIRELEYQKEKSKAMVNLIADEDLCF